MSLKQHKTNSNGPDVMKTALTSTSSQEMKPPSKYLTKRKACLRVLTVKKKKHFKQF